MSASGLAGACPCLTINVGSSSLKFSVVSNGERLARGAFERLGTPQCEWSAEIGSGRRTGKASGGSAGEVFSAIGECLAGVPLACVAHRIVHGGEVFPDHCLADPATIEALESISHLAPEHLPGEIKFLKASLAHFGELPHAACFDTVFHRPMPEVARAYALPEAARGAGIRRYGFHGLSYASLVRCLKGRGECGGRSVLAHLGNGASLAAVRDGAPQDTTMGFTPAAGLVMGTRCGDTDPGIFLYLVERLGLSPAEVDRMLNHQSGLAGLSGIGPDVRDLMAVEDSNPDAALALNVFCHSARKHIAGMAASLGGVDRLVFAGGIGEHAGPVRARICEGLEFLGIVLDDAANAASEEVISAANSAVRVLVIPTDEEGEMARIARTLLGQLDEPTASFTPTTLNQPNNP